MDKLRKKDFTWLEGTAFALAAVAVQLTSETTAQWGTYFYSPADTGRRTIYVSIGIVWLIFVAGRLLDGITDPLIGIWSDRFRTEPGRLRFPRIRGRRRPLVFWGSILMAFTMVAMWFPPIHGESWANFFYALFIVSLHWVFWTLCVIPLNALMPEIARSAEARVKLGIWYSVGMVVGLAAVEVIVPMLLSALDPSRAAGADVFSPVGYQRTSIILAAVSVVLFQFFVWAVKERHTSDGAAQRVPALRDMLAALKNKACLIFLAAFFLHAIGILAVQKALPYWTELGLQGDESTVAKCMIPYILMTLVSYAFVPWLARRFSVKWLMFSGMALYAFGLPITYAIAVLPVTPETKLAFAFALFGLIGIAQGFIFVLIVPMLGEIIDLDERDTGRRREAVYGGLHGVATKIGQACSILVATQLMHIFGNSTGRPLGAFLVGPVGGVFVVLGMVVLCFYPVVKAPEAPKSS